MRITWVVAAVALLLLPAVQAANSATITLNPVFTRMDLNAAGELPQDFATRVRELSDRDRDGQVNQTEAEAFTTQAKQFGDKMAADEVKKQTTLDGNAPTDVVASSTLTGLVGAVASQVPVTTTISVALTFSPGPGPLHTLIAQSSNASAAGVSTITMTMTSPDGFEIVSHTGQTNAVLSADKKALTWEANTTSAGTFVFGPLAASASSSIPGPGMLLGALVVAVATIIRRRARQRQ